MITVVYHILELRQILFQQLAKNKTIANCVIRHTLVLHILACHSLVLKFKETLHISLMKYIKCNKNSNKLSILIWFNPRCQNCQNKIFYT